MFFPIHCIWLRCMLQWLNWILHRLKFYSSYQCKYIFPYLDFSRREVRVCKNSLWKAALLLWLSFSLYYLCYFLKESSRLINIFSSVVSKQQKQEQNSQQAAGFTPPIWVSGRGEYWALELKCLSFLSVASFHYTWERLFLKHTFS